MLSLRYASLFLIISIIYVYKWIDFIFVCMSCCAYVLYLKYLLKITEFLFVSERGSFHRCVNLSLWFLPSSSFSFSYTLISLIAYNLCIVLYLLSTLCFKFLFHRYSIHIMSLFSSLHSFNYIFYIYFVLCFSYLSFMPVLMFVTLLSSTCHLLPSYMYCSTFLIRTWCHLITGVICTPVHPVPAFDLFISRGPTSNCLCLTMPAHLNIATFSSEKCTVVT